MDVSVCLMFLNILRVEHLLGCLGSSGGSSSSRELHRHPIGIESESFLNGAGDGERVVVVGKAMDGAEGEGESGGVGSDGNFVLFMSLGDSSLGDWRRGVV